MYEEGKAPEEIARRFDVHKNTVYSVLERTGACLRRAKRSFLSKAQMEQIKRLYEQGKTYQEVALALRISWATAKKYGQRAGVSSRPAGFQRGRDHHAWIGGRVQTSQGYVLSRVYEDDPLFCMAKKKAAGASYALEHRLVMARHLGRPLEDFETVHHRDGDRQNNRIRNLQLLTGRHGKGACFRCGDCGSYNVKPVRLGAH